MNLRIFLVGAVMGLAGFGCSNMEQDAAPAPAPMVHNDGPPVDQTTPNTGGELFNGNY